MGYYTTLYLHNVKIKPGSVPVVTKAVKTSKKRILSELDFFLKNLHINNSGDLSLKSQTEKWYESEKTANWLKLHASKGGRMILHSVEGDGTAFGWEFDGKEKMRYFQLDSYGRWR